MASSPLVADINPLLQSLQQFTPAAREDRRLQLAGLGQLQDLRQSQIDVSQATLEEKNLANKRAQILDVAETNRADLLGDQSDINFVLQNGPEGLRNRIALLVKDKSDLGDEEMQEFIGVANMATTDPEGAFKMLQGNLERVTSQLGVVDDILTQTRSRTNAALQLRGDLIKDLQSTDPETRKSASIALGLTGRASGAAPQVVEIGGVPHIFDKQSKTMVPVQVAGQQVTAATVGATEASIAQEVAAAKATGTAGVELETAPQIAAATDAAKAGIKRSEKAFDSIGKIRTNIANLDEAIRLIDAGAETGAISSLFPSFTEASVALENLQGRLGLDVIGQTTFGALSESELKFALDTALPTNLDGEPLKRWLRAKKQSQEKLSTYLTSVATFMGRGGTVADFLELQKANQVLGETGTAAPTPPGGATFLGFE